MSSCPKYLETANQTKDCITLGGELSFDRALAYPGSHTYRFTVFSSDPLPACSPISPSVGFLLSQPILQTLSVNPTT